MKKTYSVDNWYQMKQNNQIVTMINIFFLTTPKQIILLSV